MKFHQLDTLTAVMAFTTSGLLAKVIAGKGTELHTGLPVTLEASVEKRLLIRQRRQDLAITSAKPERSR